MRVKIICCHRGPCRAIRQWEGEIATYQVPVVALWFHAAHEGHMFEWWEDGRKILPALSELS